MTEEIIIDGVNVAGCEYHTPTCVSTHLWGTLTKSTKCEENPNCYYKQFKRLEQELKWANDEEKYLKDCCIKAGKELEKHSFKWDGKEKNLVVQALQLNQLYEKSEQELDELKKACEKCKLFDIEKTNRDLLERIDKLEQENKELIEDNLNFSKENKELKKQLSSTKCYLCGEGFLTPEGAELYLENKQMKSALEEINITVKQLLQGVSSNCINNTPYLTALSLIETKINEVLEDEKMS